MTNALAIDSATDEAGKDRYFMAKLVPIESIVSKIVFLRDENVILDRDLAELYGVETRVLNQAVSRNVKRFPPDFMFTLTRDEIMRISQIVTSSEIKYSKRVRAFTEQGVAMLSSVLNSERAIEVNVAIIRAFVHLRKMVSSHKELARKLKELEQHIKDHDEQIQAIFEAIQQLISLPENSQKKIGFTVKERKASYGKGKTKKQASPKTQ
jgi:phage regulator Rha-like protein